MMMVMPRSLSLISSSTMSVTSDCDRPGHRLVGDQELGIGRHGAGELELAHLDLGEVARQPMQLRREPDQPGQLLAAVFDFRLGQVPAAAGVRGEEQRNAQVFRDRQRRERARQLEAPRHAAMGALVRRKPIHRMAVELHRAGLVLQCAAHAVDQRRLARAVRADQADALALRDLEIDAVERDEAAEALAEILDLEQRRGHQRAPGRMLAKMAKRDRQVFVPSVRAPPRM